MDSTIDTQSHLPTKFCRSVGAGSAIKRAPLSNPPLALANEISDLLFTHAVECFAQKGTLKLDQTGLLYIDLDNQLLYHLFQVLGLPQAELPPYFISPKAYGAHISVIYPHEVDTLNQVIPELGTMLPFTITGCYATTPENLPTVSRIWFLTILSPLLSDIRTSLKLSPLPDGQSFHITLALEKEFLFLDDFLSLGEESQMHVSSQFAIERKIQKSKASLDDTP